jgi:hypothetical protein
MRINRKEGVGHHYLNDDNVVVRLGGNEGKGDSLGRNAKALVTFDHPEDQADLIKGIKSFFVDTHDHLYPMRYPKGEEFAVRGNSRDHVLKAVAALELKGDPFAKDYRNRRLRRPSVEMPFTPTQKLLFKGMDSKFWSWVYVLAESPYLLLMRAWSSFIRAAFHFKPTGGQLKYYHAMKVFEKRTKAQKWLSKNQVILPTFALFYTAFTVHALKSERAKRFILKNLLKPMFEKHNYVGKMLCGELIDPELIKAYIPTRKFRWSTRLNSENDRDMRLYPEDLEIPGANTELAMLYALNENQAKYGAYQALGPKVQA